ncbi:hypothetical protein sos41_07760 [Alphaproteobacteria bacterium SO-S41]|nr:hypothetical protein sos41_07760 [Alphaproteobacteria bacterium SO-S41]
MARPKSPFQRPKRRRGGQPGNTNRLRHGFYTRATRQENLAARLLLGEVELTLARLTTGQEGEGPTPGFPGSNKG